MVRMILLISFVALGSSIVEGLCGYDCYSDQECSEGGDSCTACQGLYDGDGHCAQASHLNADNKPSVADAANANVTLVHKERHAQMAAGPCCKECKLPLIKYYSVDRAHGFCGDACMDPKKFSIYKKFEANLTLVDADHPACAGQLTPDGKFYTDYDSTVTHGDPFGILAVTLDLYAPTGMPDHSCCSTPIVVPVVGPVNCKGKPQNMTIRGTGPYCCPATSTEEKPCKPKVNTVLKIKQPTCGIACHTDMKCSMLAAADGSGCDKCAIKGVYTGFCCGSAGKPCDKEEASADKASLII